MGRASTSWLSRGRLVSSFFALRTVSLIVPFIFIFIYCASSVSSKSILRSNFLVLIAALLCSCRYINDSFSLRHLCFVSSISIVQLFALRLSRGRLRSICHCTRANDYLQLLLLFLFTVRGFGRLLKVWCNLSTS